MGTKTNIEWTDHTFNPWIGCTKVSAGCANCYAAARDARHLHGPVDHWGPGAPRKTMSAGYWAQPDKWTELARREGRRHKVFTASMADIFDKEAPLLERQTLWQAMQRTSDWLDWQIVTKRPERIQDVMGDDRLEADFFEKHRCWLITSIENQAAANARIPELLKIRAAVHGISAEPLMGSVNLKGIRWETAGSGGPAYVDVAGGTFCTVGGSGMCGPRLDWVICGGESGPGARPMHPDWARGLRDQCQAAGVPFFFKQWGEYLPPMTDGALIDGAQAINASDDFVRVGKHKAGSLLDGVEWKQFPGVRG